MTVDAHEIRSKAVPLYQLLTVGRLDKSGDFCEGAHLRRDQALMVAKYVLCGERGLQDEDAAALTWIAAFMPADGTVPA